MQRPRSPEGYAELVRQSLLETEELRKLYEAMQEGSYDFADADLPFMTIVDRQNERVLPFKRMLSLINLTHRQGLDSGEK